jgi:hypothetical protein
MSEKTNAKKKVVIAKESHDISTSRATPEDQSRQIDAEIKRTAGHVQEELEPIRKSAGHAHTH